MTDTGWEKRNRSGSRASEGLRHSLQGLVQAHIYNTGFPTSHLPLLISNEKLVQKHLYLQIKVMASSVAAKQCLRMSRGPRAKMIMLVGGE